MKYHVPLLVHGLSLITNYIAFHPSTEKTIFLNLCCFMKWLGELDYSETFIDYYMIR